MPNNLVLFENVARALARLPRQEPATEPAVASPALHPFDSRNIHPKLPPKVRQLFDDGHFPEATELAFKFLDKQVHHHSKINDSGYKLMMTAFDADKLKIKLNALSTISEKDEQQGYRHIFAGAMLGIRNPRAHEPAIVDDPDVCLDHLSFASMLLRRLEQSGYKTEDKLKKATI